LRLSPRDRIPGGESQPKKSSSRRKAEDDDGDDEPPPERKPRPSRGSKRKSRARRGANFYRLFYWGAVLGLWTMIAAVGVVVYVGAHLPPIQALEIPKRPPTIQITGI